MSSKKFYKVKKFFKFVFSKNGSLREALVHFFDHHETPLANDQLQMVLSVVQLAEYDADRIKIPINKIVDLPVDAALDKVIRVLKRSGHSRVPIYEDSEGIKKFVGLLYAKDILKVHLNKRKRFKLKDYIREIRFVPEMQKLLSLLRDMRIQQNHLVLTVNEYGDVTGLITLEDILEEIVGDIRDEHDSNKKMINEIKHRQYRVDASLPLSDLNKELAINLPEEKFNTLAGYMLHELKGKPKKGSEVKYGQIQLRVEKSTRQEVQSVLVKIKTIK